MQSIEKIIEPHAFDTGWWLDWAQDPLAGSGQAAQRCPVGDDIPGLRSTPLLPGQICPPPAAYLLQETEVQVGGPQVELRFCGDTFGCNLNFGDGLLVAPHVPGPPVAGAAPIRLKFSKPLRAVGAYVAGGSFTQPVGARFVARLWVRLEGRLNFEPAVTVAGVTGAFVQAGTARPAPFCGARSLAPAGITEARFDLSPTLPDEVNQVILAHLYAMT